MISIKYTIAGLSNSYDMSGEPDTPSYPYNGTGYASLNGEYFSSITPSEGNCNYLTWGGDILETASITYSGHPSWLGHTITFRVYYSGGVTLGDLDIYTTFSQNSNRVHVYSCIPKGTPYDVSLSPLPAPVTWTYYVPYGSYGGDRASSYTFTIKREFVVVPVP